MNQQAFTQIKLDHAYLRDDFMSDNFRSEEKFFITLYNLCIGLSQLLYPEIVKIRQNLD